MPDRRRIAGQRRRDKLTDQVTPVTTEAAEELDDEISAPSITTQSDIGSQSPTVTKANQAPDTGESTEADEARDTDESAGAGAAEGEGAERSGRVGLLLTATLSALIVLVLALAAVLGVKAWRGQEAEDARGEAVKAGRAAAETALSYDYRDLDKSFAAARGTMTPEFAGKFDQTAKVAGELATKTKATVRAEVREVGVRDGDADRVTLVIFVNQTTTSTITQGKPRVDLNRTRFTMVRNGTRWLVQEIAGL